MFNVAEEWENEQGMSLRDYFAARAMQGMVANSNTTALENVSYLADKSYEIADAMLVEREKRTES